jgi:hypothetical protein
VLQPHLPGVFLTGLKHCQLLGQHTQSKESICSNALYTTNFESVLPGWYDGAMRIASLAPETECKVECCYMPLHKEYLQDSICTTLRTCEPTVGVAAAAAAACPERLPQVRSRAQHL